ncbi:unnamed protein product [Mytilus edulis]|uniref:Uncharacterized protein n=1 Tax=Mytilus edulis TaxID=6550 RepID=A0A8S3U5W6_MYTED|nr:unnamed protein product [Mytilus edulis]
MEAIYAKKLMEDVKAENMIVCTIKLMTQFYLFRLGMRINTFGTGNLLDGLVERSDTSIGNCEKNIKQAITENNNVFKRHSDENTGRLMRKLEELDAKIEASAKLDPYFRSDHDELAVFTSVFCTSDRAAILDSDVMNQMLDCNIGRETREKQTQTEIEMIVSTEFIYRNLAMIEGLHTTVDEISKENQMLKETVDKDNLRFRTDLKTLTEEKERSKSPCYLSIDEEKMKLPPKLIQRKSRETKRQQQHESQDLAESVYDFRGKSRSLQS